MTREEVLLVAAATGLDPRTVHRVLVDGKSPQSRLTKRAIVDALRKLGNEPAAAALESAGE